MHTVNKNRIRSLATAGLLSFSVLAQTAHAESAQSTYYTYADVVAVEPSYSRLTISEPVEHCYDLPASTRRNYYDGARYDHDRPHYRQDHGHPGATLLGGIIGGLIGNQFGGGNGRKALTDRRHGYRRVRRQSRGATSCPARIRLPASCPGTPLHHHHGNTRTHGSRWLRRDLPVSRSGIHQAGKRASR